ncbi:hypothetical protein THRCLA_22311 [Thraustotheca clavata]|uniref:Uncharacterized protein n=1 Tax=Thraustotheca clavata TaxID=74557 RepID=A0A1V9Z6C3_9STRA|nr:hypothetical protein THRCLA_22311 [Thraustotheca clavata]
MIARVVKPMEKTLSRSFMASSRRLAGGDHHPHTVFTDETFSRKRVGAWVWTFVVGGIGATLGICQFQNYKGGFPQKNSFTASARRLAGGDHHPHTVFNDKSFTSKNVGGFLLTWIIGGTAATLGMVHFQNAKGGFPQKKE